MSPPLAFTADSNALRGLPSILFLSWNSRLARRLWHPCTDGLDHVVEALDRLVDLNRNDALIDIALLHESIRSQMTCPSSALQRALDGPGTGTARYGNTVEMTRRWLQTNGFVSDSAEFIRRVRGVQSRLRDWEEAARASVEWNGVDIGYRFEDDPSYRPTATDWFGSDNCEALDEILDEASDVRSFVGQLAGMIRGKLDAKPPADSTSPTGGATTTPPKSRSDGLYPPRTIVFRGAEYDCPGLTLQQMAFLRVAMPNVETHLASLFGATGVWDKTFTGIAKQRARITKLISRTNRKLIDCSPTLGVSFSLRSGQDFISRLDPKPAHVAPVAADNPLTKD